MKPRLELIIMFLLVIVPAGYVESALYIDDTSTTDKGHFSLEFSLDYYKDVEKEFDPETEEYTKTLSKEIALTSSIAYGLTDNWELEVVTPYKFLDGTSTGRVNGFSDTIIDTKYRLWDEKKILPSFALYLDLKTDSGNDDKSLGTGKKNYSVNSILTKTAGNNLLDLNLGYTFVGGDTDNILFYACDWERIFTKCISLCNEIYGETTFKEGFDKNIFIYGVSLSYQLNKMICLDSGIGIGISKVSPDLQVSTTFTFDF